MNIMGIKFALSNIPFQRRLQTLAAGAFINALYVSGFLAATFLIYLIAFTRYWPEAILYLIWAYVIDVKSSERGARRNKWVRDWIWWKYLKDFFPFKLEKRNGGAHLDPKRNYLCCCFPHGIFPCGTFIAFGTNRGGFSALFPRHTPYLTLLGAYFLNPLLRELLLLLGICDASANSLNWILGAKGGGNVAALIIGGQAETIPFKLGEYKIVLRNRKGFVKVALQNGAPLVPVFTFGEPDVLDKVDYPEGCLLDRMIKWFKRVTGVLTVIPKGRGYFQYSFGIVPYRKPLHTIIGAPIEVVRVKNPTQEDIDALHEEFIIQLRKLFDEHKYIYLSNPNEIALTIF